ATSLPLVFASVQSSNAGTYELVTFNAVGVAFSQPATLSVRVPVIITQHPVTTDVRVRPDPQAVATTNATFTVAAYSIGTIEYQWRRDGVDIPGANGTTYTVVDVTTNDLATFSVLVTDEVSSVLSSNVWLYPWVSPTFTISPISQTVPVGSQVTLSASVFGWPPPFTFEWRLGNTPVFVTIGEDMTSFFTFTASSTLTPSLSYRPVIKNRARPAGVAATAAVITTLADNDADGIPDNWETVYGFNTNNVSDRLLDSDSDGMLNWQEYVAGTDPTNPLSNLKLASTMSSNGVAMEFQAMSNKTYSVQYNGTIAGTNWHYVRKVLAARSNYMEAASDPLTPSNRFYRVVTPAQ
ncbi:MAG TPA: hypothetical protein VK530_09640, partial [Candidatus Acidoferrum sp.]|nr:hypothetical protein [Candidatus Acidoferrum sp.]